MATDSQSTAVEVKWQEPPGLNRGAKSPKWALIADQLRSRPGEWAIVAESMSPALAANIRRGYCAGMPAGEFEATARSNGYEGNRVDIYARYIGGPA